jgi:sugar lactone lactonase YvrE
MRLRTVICVSALLVVSTGSLPAQGIITTVAGSGSLPNGSAALIAPLGSPVSLITDSNNNVYGIDGGHFQVFKITPSGILTVVAGSGTPGFSGDGGPATQAQLGMYLSAIAFDQAGNLFIADASNGRVRKVDTSGNITTFAGGTGGFGGDNGPATSASFRGIAGLAVDSQGNLFVADTFNNRIRKVTPGGTITTAYGNGGYATVDGTPAATTGLYQPNVLAFDPQGNLYVSEYNYPYIFIITSGGIIATIANSSQQDAGSSPGSPMSAPSAMTTDSAGNLYVTDNYKEVRKVSSGIFTRVAGGTPGYGGDGGSALSAQLYMPGGLTFDSTGQLYIADSGNNRIRLVDGSGVIHAFAGSGNPTFYLPTLPASSAQLNRPQGLALDPSGNLLIADTGNHRIAKVDLNGNLSNFAGTGAQGTGATPGPATSVALNGPQGVAADANYVYIADSGNSRILKVDSKGNMTTVISDGNGGNIAVDKSGNVYFAYSSVFTEGTVTEVSPDGANGLIASPAVAPTGVAIDSTGLLYIPDSSKAIIYRLDVLGSAQIFAGTGTLGTSLDGRLATQTQLSQLAAVAPDSSGNVYFTDLYRVRRVAPSGIVTAVAGTTTSGFAGDNGNAAASLLALPGGLVADNNNNLYISDTLNNRVRKVTTILSDGLVVLGATQGAAGRVARVPLTLSLHGINQIGNLSFSLLVTPTGGAAALTGALSFQQDAALAAPVVAATGSTGIAITWAALASPLVDSTHLGDLLITIPPSATLGSVYQVTVAASASSSPGGAIPLSLVSSADVTVAPDYLVGDSIPSGSDNIGGFGDNVLNSLDLIQLFRTVAGVPGYTPPLVCSDLFDAMDAFPADSGGTRGGDGVLDNLDLLTVLRRVSGVDSSAPRRFSRGLYCPGAGMAAEAKTRAPAAGLLETGDATASREGSEAWRVPLYLTVSEPKSFAGFSFSVELSKHEGINLRFLPALVPTPTLSDSALPGILALAWLDGLNLPGGRILLGYVEFPRTALAPQLRIHGGSGR